MAREKKNNNNENNKPRETDMREKDGDAFATDSSVCVHLDSVHIAIVAYHMVYICIALLVLFL